MSKLQCIVTSYKRLKYLRPCLESMALDPVEIYVVDGGGDKAVEQFLFQARYSGLVKDFLITAEENPGADVLKNIGIERFISQPRFIISSDDFLFHRGWSEKLRAQYDALNQGGLRFPMVTLPTELVIERHRIATNKYEKLYGVDHMPVTSAMVAGTMMDTAATKSVGCFPAYGKGGHGDIAIGLRFARCGFKCAYLASPIIWHLGAEKERDYEAYSKDFDADNERWFKAAQKDEWKP